MTRTLGIIAGVLILCAGLWTLGPTIGLIGTGTVIITVMVLSEDDEA